MTGQTGAIVTRVPLPSSLSPDLVLQALHRFEPLIAANPYLLRYERRPVPIPDVVADPFFREDGRRLQAYVVYDRVPLLPGVAAAWATKDVTIPCVFQSFARGARCRAEAQAGVVVRSSYEVRRRGEVLDSGDEAPPAAVAAESGDFELVEIAYVECSPLVKPFVKRSFVSAHQEILQRVVDTILSVTAPSYM